MAKACRFRKKKKAGKFTPEEFAKHQTEKPGVKV
jgi:hypothetical protein